MKQLTERQNSLQLLKNFEASKKWTLIKEDLDARREWNGNYVLDAYAFPNEWADLIEEVKYNHKNKAIWGLNELSKFKSALWTWDAENLILKEIDERIESSELYIKYQIGMDSNFTRPTEVVFTETDKASYMAQVLKDLSGIVSRHIKDLEKKPEDTAAQEDESSLADDPYEGTDSDVEVIER